MIRTHSGTEHVGRHNRLLSHFIYEETEAQRRQMIYPKSALEQDCKSISVNTNQITGSENWLKGLRKKEKRQALEATESRAPPGKEIGKFRKLG